MRTGGALRGCLVSVLLLVAVIYLVEGAASIAFDYFRFRDAIQQEARFAPARSDEAIRIRLRALVDSLDLPDDARRIRIERDSSAIQIWSEYDQDIPIAWLSRRVHFRAMGDTKF